MGIDTLEHHDQLAEYEISQLSRVAALAEWSPEIFEAREQALVQAQQIYDRNHELLMAGEFDKVPMPIDAIGDARFQVEMEETHGPFSQQALEAGEATVLSADRALGEAMRALTWEVFKPKRRRFDDEQEVFVSEGRRPIIKQLHKGLSPIASADEVSRRFPETIEEETYNAIAKHRSFDPNTWILTLSLAGKDKDMGYVHKTDKWMARGVSFGEDEQGIYRDDEQAGLSGRGITEEIIDETIEELEIVAPGTRLTRSEKLGLQIELDKKYFPTLLSFIEYLDVKAGTHMGEPIEPGTERDYAMVVAEAERRHQEQEAKRLEVAAYSLELARNKVDAHTSKQLMHVFIDKKAHEIVCQQPEAARAVFGDETADRYQEALELERLGEYEAAEGMRNTAEEEAPLVGYCGAGSCGLEKLAELDQAALKARAAGLEGELLRSTESKCRGECLKEGKKGDVLVNMKGSKFCAECGSSDIKGISAALSDFFASKAKSN